MMLLALLGISTALAGKPLPKSKPTPAQLIVRTLSPLGVSPSLKAVRKLKPLLGAGASRFEDVITSLEIQAVLREAEHAEIKNRRPAAAKLAREAMEKNARLLRDEPDSPWARRAPEDGVRAELILAANGPSAASARCLERAVFRMSQANGLQAAAMLSHFTADRLARIAPRCAEPQAEACRAALRKVYDKIASESPEAKSLTQTIPKITEKPSPLEPSLGRLTQVYKAPEPDLAAADDAVAAAIRDPGNASGQKLRKVLDEFPRSSQRNRVRYWLGRMEKQIRHDEDAQKIWRDLATENALGWHGLLARLALGDPPLPLSVSSEPSEGTALELPKQDPLLLPAEKKRLERAEAWIDAAAPEFAAVELRDLKPRDPLSTGHLLYWMDIGSRAHAYSFTFQTATEVLQRAASNSTLQSRLPFLAARIFPTSPFALIEPLSQAAGVPPLVFLGLVKQESAFDPQAVSSSGALGYSQLMPFTALHVAPGTARAEILTPQTNLRIGATYLGQMLKRWEGNVALALASYNAGPTAVDRWVKSTYVSEDSKARFGLIEFVDLIPYRETREYVGSILRNVYWYSARLGKPLPQSLDSFWIAPKLKR